MRRVMQFVEQDDGTYDLKYFNKDRNLDMQGQAVKQSDLTPHDR